MCPKNIYIGLQVTDLGTLGPKHILFGHMDPYRVRSNSPAAMLESSPVPKGYGSFRKYRVPYFGVPIIRILLFEI